MERRLDVFYFVAVDGNRYDLAPLIHQIQDRGYSEPDAIAMAKDETNGWLTDHQEDSK